MGATRVGIELSSGGCRVVEIDGGRSMGGPAPQTRVQSYAVVPAGGAEMSERLTALRHRDAAVVVWGMRSAHHQSIVPQSGYDKMRADALASARDAGIQSDGMFADIAPAGPLEKGTGSRPVVAVMAAADELSLAIQPIVDAGLLVRSVTTPAGALTSLARARGLSVPESIDAYVALDEMATAVALVRDGALVAARELPWGYLDVASARPQPRRREDIAARLVVELARLCSRAGVTSSSLRQVAICGGLGDLRSMTTSMMEALDVEVEPLDGLFGIDETRLPEPADDFRERSAELRLAWAVVADWPGPLNLLRHRQRRARRTALARAAIVAGVGVGLGAGWLIERGAWWQSTAEVARVSPPPTTVRTTSPPMPGRATPPPTTSSGMPPRAPAPPPPEIARTAPPILQPSLPPARPSPAPPTRVGPPLPPPPTQMTRPAPPLPSPPAPLARATTPLPAPLPARPAAPPSALAEQPVASPAPVPPVVPPPRFLPTAPAAEPPLAARRPAPPARSRERPPAPLPPFDAVLGSILYSPDRKLAIIDGRIVGPGDEVKGARLVNITPGAVTLRDAQGRLRTLVLASPGQGRP